MGYLRFFLAVAVVVVHMGGVYGYKPLTGRAAVEIFFVISGYLMALVLTEKYKPTELRSFYVSRLVRLYPSYLFALVFALSVGWLIWDASKWITHWRSHGAELGLAQIAFLILSQLLIVGSEIPLFLSAAEGQWALRLDAIDTSVWRFQLVPPAWSLSLEVVFYAMAPFLATLRTKSLLGITLGLLVAKAFTLWMSTGDNGPLDYRFLPFEAAAFLGGMIAYRCRAAIVGRVNAVVALGGLALLLPTFQAVNWGARAAGFSEEIPSVALVVWAAVALPHLAGQAGMNGRIENQLGQLSLPIYLLHWPMLELFGSMAWFQESIPGVRVGAVFSATVLVSLVSNWAAEKSGAWLRALLTPPCRAERTQRGGPPEVDGGRVSSRVSVDSITRYPVDVLKPTPVKAK
ncbi:MAG: acyltransferase [Rhodoferax sp.]|nr:acyltransferase [Rhodoferax sp.]